MLLAFALLACSPSVPLAGDQIAAGQPGGVEESKVDKDDTGPAATGGGVANLPFSHGRSFQTLDEYLEHLERHAAPIDQPWWREVRPGVYQHVKRLPGAAPEVATRAELMKRFGFTS